MKPRSHHHLAHLLLLTLLLSGCAGLLPRGRSETTPFEDFDEARRAIESLVPMHSDMAVLQHLGLDPAKQPNTLILTHADIVRRFVPSALLKREDLDPGVLTCLEAVNDCRGWEITAARIAKVRTGNFLTDFANFSRRTETTGWRFNALILTVKDVVVFRSWGGQPRLNELDVNTNPLGPFQDLGPYLLTNP